MKKITETLSREEIQFLTRASDLRGFLAVGTTWAMIIGSFLLVAFFPNGFTVFVALVILGGRHLALAILMHDASHYSLFKTRKLNDWLGAWICAYPTWSDLARYRKHHLKHHQFAGSTDDPDISLIRGFPLSRASLLRKFARDLTGISGLKRVYGLLLMDFGFVEYTVASELYPVPQEGRRVLSILWMGLKNMAGFILTNCAFILVLAIFGHAELYLLWVISYLTTFSLFVRIRAIAEHACTEQDLDPMKSTRTTHASPLARVTVAPHRVNYHLEHHLLMTVPSFNLPKLHRMLKERHALSEAFVAPNYLEVLQIATRACAKAR